MLRRPGAFGLRSQLIALFAIFALAPLAISNTFGYLQTRDILIAQGFGNLRNLAARSALELERSLHGWRDALENVAAADPQGLVAAVDADPRLVLMSLARPLLAGARPGDELLLLTM